MLAHLGQFVFFPRVLHVWQVFDQSWTIGAGVGLVASDSCFSSRVIRVYLFLTVFHFGCLMVDYLHYFFRLEKSDVTRLDGLKFCG